MSNINWQVDLDQLAIELPKLHRNLFFNEKEEEPFYSSIKTLKERIEKMGNYSIVMEIARIVSLPSGMHILQLHCHDTTGCLLNVTGFKRVFLLHRPCRNSETYSIIKCLKLEVCQLTTLSND